VTPDAIQWGPAPTILPAGAKVAVLEGDPGPWKLVYVNPADQPKTSSSQ
jgi:hypothetical protein